MSLLICHRGLKVNICLEHDNNGGALSKQKKLVFVILQFN